jgi:hypothetical protein
MQMNTNGLRILGNDLKSGRKLSKWWVRRLFNDPLSTAKFVRVLEGTMEEMVPLKQGTILAFSRRMRKITKAADLNRVRT